MTDNVVLLLFLGLIFGVIGWILFTLLAKYMKGSITVNLPKRAYKFGEKLTWNFKLHSKKEILGESLIVHLVGYERISKYGKDGKKHTRREIFARFSQDIAGEVKYVAGEKKDFNIAIQIPSYDEIFREKKDIDLGDSTIWKLASYALNNSKRNQITWQLQVDLEAKWLDIHGKKDIFITQ